MTPGEIEGANVGIDQVGTSSISVALEHKAPFWMFGPEMWVKECQLGDACSAPVMVSGELTYIITLVSMEQVAMPQDAVISLLFTMRKALERHLSEAVRIKAEEAILDATPFAVYHVLPGGEVAYANRLGHTRLEGIGAKRDPGTRRSASNLNDVIMNYQHTPIYKGFRGIPSYNKEVTCITPAKTYEDITTVVPLERDEDQAVQSVVVVSMPIEDLRTLVAHAAGYTAKYSLGSMVGEGTTFASVRNKAARVAKNKHHVLIQGEAGTGKQRMAHGIHQGSPRAAGPLITLRCGDTTPELLEQELFGVVLNSEVSHQGRLELASGGTLFLDEIEKMPKSIAKELAAALNKGKACRVGEQVERSIDVRIIAACDSDLKRLTERGLFDRDLYDALSKSIVRVPALRSRREDIPKLAAHIISELAEQHQMQPKKILPETEEVLRNYDWPGNIKQLQSVLEYAFFNTTETEINPHDISLMGDVKPDNKWKEDKEVFVKAWQAAGGNVSRLANLLNVSRVTLYRYLKKYGLEKK
jgi:transcriptional regulator with PAS, ATPase and Fis domain